MHNNIFLQVYVLSYMNIDGVNVPRVLVNNFVLLYVFFCVEIFSWARIAIGDMLSMS